MVFKYVVMCVLLTLGLQANAFMSKEECVDVAENVAAAQDLLNQNPVVFEATTRQIEKLSPEQLDWSKEQKDFVLALVKKLKQGGQPEKAGQVAYLGCVAKQKAI